MITERQQCQKFFGLYRGERHRYSNMKRVQPEIDKQIRGGILIGQLTLDGDMEVRRVRQRREEPTALDNS